MPSFAVISCKKYTRQTLRIVETDDPTTLKDRLDKLRNMECILCGPMSHVELSWHNWFIIHSILPSLDEAKIYAKGLTTSHPDSFSYTEPTS